MAHGLTALRLALVVPLALGFLRPDLVPPVWLLATLLAAIGSDLLDGVVARRLGTDSSTGQLFDHGTDCTFVVVGLAAAAYVGLLNPWLPALVAIAFLQYVLDSRLLHRQRRLRASRLGRLNGILYFVPLLGLALAGLESLAAIADGLRTTCGWLAWGLVVSTLASIIDRGLAPRSGEGET